MPGDRENRLQLLRDHVAAHGISTAHMMKLLSDDAKAVAGAVFGFMSPGRGVLSFRMIENRPTGRAQAALDELVAMGAVAFERRDGVEYTLRVNPIDFRRWMARNLNREDIRFPMAEPPATPPDPENHPPRPGLDLIG